MDVSSIATLATGMADARNSQEIGIAVLKKALESQAASATALIAAIPVAPTPNLPAHLGRNINTTA